LSVSLMTRAEMEAGWLTMYLCEGV
jgi:hypothetical protein